MATFEAFDPEVEVNGETVLAVADGMGGFREQALRILGDCGIRDPAPGRWYRQQSWLDAFKIISQSIGPNTLFSIGYRIPENATFPQEISDIDAALASIDVAYHMNHRGGEIGHYAYEKTGPTSVRLTCRNPYPCDFDRGIIEAVARRFRPGGKVIAVEHEHPAECRNLGGSSCTYSVRWD